MSYAPSTRVVSPAPSWGSWSLQRHVGAETVLPTLAYRLTQQRQTKELENRNPEHREDIHQWNCPVHLTCVLGVPAAPSLWKKRCAEQPLGARMRVGCGVCAGGSCLGRRGLGGLPFFIVYERENQIANLSRVPPEFQSRASHFVLHVSTGLWYWHGQTCSLVMGLMSWVMPEQVCRWDWLAGGREHIINALHSSKSPFGAALPELRGRKCWGTEGWQSPGSEVPQER